MNGLISSGMSVVAACRLTGYPRASFYRHHRCRSQGQGRVPVPQRDRHQPAALSPEEVAAIVEVLSCDEYAHCSISQTFYRHLDAGGWIASLATWYRVARAHGLVGDRRRRRSSSGASSRKKPELQADRPGQVWSWDITKLPTPVRGRYLHLYVVMDVYSRYVVGWAVHEREDGRLAQTLIDRAIKSHGVPDYIHSDNGAAMTSTPVSGLAAKLGITLSFSRPKTSNDNPYSEALFKTYKYDLDFPEIFTGTIEAALQCEHFFNTYNTTHCHSGIAHHTPANVHYARTGPIDRARQAILDHAYRMHPERFHYRPTPPRLPETVYINKPEHTTTTTNLSQTG